jgi:hypothetical protein
MARLGLVTEDDDAKSATITLADRLSESSRAQTLEELRGADIKHGSVPLTKFEGRDHRAALPPPCQHRLVAIIQVIKPANSDTYASVPR